MHHTFGHYGSQCIHNIDYHGGQSPAIAEIVRQIGLCVTECQLGGRTSQHRTIAWAILGSCHRVSEPPLTMA